MKKLMLVLFSLAFIVLSAGQIYATLIESRLVFYNNSTWDGSDSNINLLDDAAIGVDKSALLPGQTSAFNNVTNYMSGINGIMIDISGLTVSPSLSDFNFLVGNDSDVSTWVAAPVPANFAVRSGAGLNGSDRVTIAWNNYSIENRWLQISAETTLGLAASDVFYFGNLVGDVNGDGQLTSFDSLIIMNAINSNNGSYAASIVDPLDINRDGWVTPLDAVVIENILNTSGTTSLASFIAPEGGSAPVPEPATILFLVPIY